MDTKLRQRRLLLAAVPAVLAGCAAAPTSTGPRPSPGKDVNADNVDHNVVATAASLTEMKQPDSSLAAIDRGLANTVGHKLFTVLMVDLVNDRNQRYYSNQPNAYPVGGSKQIVRTNDFFKDIVIGGKPRICYSYEDMKRAFFDHELIRSLGCESAVNYPIRWNGQTVGSLDLLHEANWYSETDLPTIGIFAGLAVAPMLKIIGHS